MNDHKTPSESDSFSVTVSFQGKSKSLDALTTKTTGVEVHRRTREVYGLADETTLKILLKGKQIPVQKNVVFSAPPKKKLKLLVMATSQVVLQDLATKRSDPTIRGFDQERKAPPKNRHELLKLHQDFWGLPEFSQQNKDYKFCRIQACTWQSFGHRATDDAPHAFEAQELLERLATDPGVVAVLKERELVVGTLGEMDPIDDRIMRAKEQEQDGSCLLGYNTNGGTRIDIKLRTDDLKGFRPYPELVNTLLHELSHNWVGDHNYLFWTNYGQMRAEYLTKHKALQSTITKGGTTTAQLAQIPKPWLHDIPSTILNELVREMAQHGIHPAAIEGPIRQRCQELQDQYLQGQTLGGGTTTTTPNDLSSARERALAAAERRRQEQQKEDEHR